MLTKGEQAAAEEEEDEEAVMAEQKAKVAAVMAEEKAEVEAEEEEVACTVIGRGTMAVAWPDCRMELIAVRRRPERARATDGMEILDVEVGEEEEEEEEAGVLGRGGKNGNHCRLLRLWPRRFLQYNGLIRVALIPSEMLDFMSIIFLSTTTLKVL